MVAHPRESSFGLVGRLPVAIVARHVLYEDSLPKPHSHSHTGIVHWIAVAQASHSLRLCVEDAVHLHMRGRPRPTSTAELIHLLFECNARLLGTSCQAHQDDGGAHTFGNKNFGQSINWSDKVEILTLPGGGRRSIAQVGTGLLYTAVLTTDGQVYTTGCGTDGRLGLGEGEDVTGNKVHGLRRVTGIIEGERIVHLAAGKKHTVVVNEGGIIFSWGCTHGGRLGPKCRSCVAPGDENTWTKHVYEPIKVIAPQLAGERVRCASAGSAHTLLLTEGGRVFSYGFPWAGALGRFNSEALSAMDEFAPCTCSVGEVDMSEHLCAPHERAVDVAAGSAHSIIATSGGKVITFGENGFGQLGLDDPTRREFAPRLVQGLRRSHAVKVAAGSDHSVVLDIKGHVHVLSTAKCGNLGRLYTEDDYVMKPLVASNQQVQGMAKQWKLLVERVATFPSSSAQIVGIAAGMDYTLARDAAGRAYSWGSGNHGKLGRCTDGASAGGAEAWTPAEVDVPQGAGPCMQVRCGPMHGGLVLGNAP